MNFKTILVLILTIHQIVAQDRYDNIWLFGHAPNRPADHFGGSMLDFTTSPPLVKYFEINTHFTECAMISDKNGNLAFYTNGCELYDHNHKKILNSDTLNPGNFYNNYCPGSISYYPTNNAEIILPINIHDSLFLFHIGLHENGQLGKFYQTSLLQKSNHEILVLEKSRFIKKNFYLTEGIQAIRHGNGRDWWIIMHEYPGNGFIKFLHTPYGLLGPYRQNIGNEWTDQFWTVQATFSPNGQWYSIISEYNGVHLYRFNRCTGFFISYIPLNHPPLGFQFYPRGGVCFSPNNKYLYVGAHYGLYQYDLSSNDIANSFELIDTIDNFTSPFNFPNSFYQLMLGPDNKIYGITANETNVMHVIHNPDKKGKACNLKQHDIILPTTYAQAMPNFPNFRAYDWDESPCDTLGIDKIPFANYRYNQDSTNYLTIEFIDLSAYSPSEWKWDFGDPTSSINTSTEQNPVHTFSKNGVYEVCLLTRNRHGETSVCQTLHIGPVSTKNLIPQIDVSQSIVLAPNPCKDLLTVSLSNYIPQKMYLYIYNSIAKKILTYKIRPGYNTLDIDFLTPGIYLLSIEENGMLVKSDKFLKE